MWEPKFPGACAGFVGDGKDCVDELAIEVEGEVPVKAIEDAGHGEVAPGLINEGGFAGAGGSAEKGGGRSVEVEEEVAASGSSEVVVGEDVLISTGGGNVGANEGFDGPAITGRWGAGSLWVGGIESDAELDVFISIEADGGADGAGLCEFEIGTFEGKGVEFIS